MRRTDLPANCTRLTATHREKLLETEFITFGCCLNLRQLAAARTAYEGCFDRYFETGTQPDRAGKPGYNLELDQFCDEPGLVRLVTHPTVLAIARAALQTRDIQYTGSILRRTRLRDMASLPQPPWHADTFILGDDPMAPDDRIAIWFYLSDTSADDGATKMLPASAAKHRHARRDGIDPYDALSTMIAGADKRTGGVHAEAPAGGGMAFKSFIFHRAVLNCSGNIRRVMTVDYRVRGSRNIQDGSFQALPKKAQSAMKKMLPKSQRRYLE